MTDEGADIDLQRRLTSLPARPVTEPEVEALSEDADGVDLSPASIRVSNPPEVTSVFVEREGTLQVAGFSPSEDAWFVYGRWTDRDKSDRAVYRLVDRWDTRYYDELTDVRA